MAKKVYISPERRDPPHGKYWGRDVYERDWCEQTAELTAAQLAARGFIVRVADRAQNIHARTADAVGWGADLYLPLHTNASANGEAEGAAQGAMVLYRAGDESSRRASELIFAELAALRGSERGARPDGSFHEIIAHAIPVAYVEAAFHDNGEDADYLTSNHSAIAQAIARGICAYFGTVYSVPGRQETVDSIRALAEEIIERLKLLA